MESRGREVTDATTTCRPRRTVAGAPDGRHRRPRRRVSIRDLWAFGGALDGVVAAFDQSSSPSASPSADPSSDPSPTTAADAVEDASHSPSPSPSASPSATTPPRIWSLTVTARSVEVLVPLALSGTVTPAVGDAARPNRVVVQIRRHQAWQTLHSAKLTWGPTRATFTDTIKDTSRPGRLAVRLVLTPRAGLTLSRTASPTVKAAIHITVSGPLARADVPYTYRAGCPVTPTHLRRIEMNFWSFNTGKIARGSLIARSSSVADLRKVFTKMFNAHFPIHKLAPVDLYKGSDVRSMAADNTSAFNCRSVTGNPYRVSQHSYGNAIDVNTYENPYVTSGHVYPSKHFLGRSPYRKGMILRHGVVQRAFTSAGWLWGARWSHPDYQHFSSNGG